MDLLPIFEALHASPLAMAIRGSIYWFPLIESAHVIALTLVFGTILIVDLRLVGLASRQRAFTRLSSELLRWTWIAFALAVATGGLMFVSEAVSYAGNTAFRIKLVLLVLAGLNMAAFHVLTLKSVGDWDTAPSTPRAARIAGALSIALWIGVIVAGRVIGFTVSGAGAQRVEPAAESEIDFDDFLSGDPSAAPPPPPPAQ